jgi:hypothetical protein
MTKNIVLVGCGNIGSRHIQALTKLPFKIKLHLVEPSLESKNLTKSRLEEISIDNIDELVWHNSIEESIPKSDLIIIATQSVGRVDLIQNLLQKGHSRFLIEKIVCQSTEEYKSLNSKFQEFNAKGWINTNRRYVESYRQLKDSIKNESFYMYVIAGNVGLGSNAYHFIDLFSWFSNDENISLNGDLLDKKITSSKRGNNLLEFSGTLTCKNKISSLTISFLSSINTPVILGFVNNENHIVINETEKKIISINGKLSLSDNFEMINVSNSTQIVNSILTEDKCELPKLNYGFNAHSELFVVFNKHILLYNGNESNLCPIS